MTRINRRIDLGRAAEDDLSNIAIWTAENFGDRQAAAYIDAILDTIDELANSPIHSKSRARNEIGPGLRTLHMSKPGRRGRHLVLYRSDDDVLTILRILHDSMELLRYLPED